MKKVIILIILTILFFNVKAQTSFGVHTGLNYSTFTKVKELTDKPPYLCGLHLGLFMNQRINNLIDIQPEINFAQKGYKWNVRYMNALDGPTQYIKFNFRYNFIEIPVLFKFFIGQNFNIFAGPQLDLCLNRKMVVKEGAEVLNQSSNSQGDYPEFNRAGFSLTGGLGYDFNNGIMLTARYTNGLSKIDKNGLDRRNSRNFLFSIGYKIFRL